MSAPAPKASTSPTPRSGHRCPSASTAPKTSDEAATAPQSVAVSIGRQRTLPAVAPETEPPLDRLVECGADGRTGAEGQNQPHAALGPPVPERRQGAKTQRRGGHRAPGRGGKNRRAAYAPRRGARGRVLDPGARRPRA